MRVRAAHIVSAWVDTLMQGAVHADRHWPRPAASISFDEQQSLVAEATGWAISRPGLPITYGRMGFRYAATGGVRAPRSVREASARGFPWFLFQAGHRSISQSPRERSGIIARKVHSRRGIGIDLRRESRRQNNWPPLKPIGMMREYIMALRTLWTVSSQPRGQGIYVRGASCPSRHPACPFTWGRSVRQMVQLAGELADGVAFNWSSADQIAWSRDQVAEGASEAAGTAQVNIMQYIRICVDEDEDIARQAYTRATLGYAMARPGASQGARISWPFRPHGIRGCA